MTKKLSIEEIARCFYRVSWADTKEYKQALNAFGKLSNSELDQFEAHISKHYGITITDRANPFSF